MGPGGWMGWWKTKEKQIPRSARDDKPGHYMGKYHWSSDAETYKSATGLYRGTSAFMIAQAEM